MPNFFAVEAFQCSFVVFPRLLHTQFLDFILQVFEYAHVLRLCDVVIFISGQLNGGSLAKLFFLPMLLILVLLQWPLSVFWGVAGTQIS